MRQDRVKKPKKQQIKNIWAEIWPKYAVYRITGHSILTNNLLNLLSVENQGFFLYAGFYCKFQVKRPT